MASASPQQPDRRESAAAEADEEGSDAEPTQVTCTALNPTLEWKQLCSFMRWHISSNRAKHSLYCMSIDSLLCQNCITSCFIVVPALAIIIKTIITYTSVAEVSRNTDIWSV